MTCCQDHSTPANNAPAVLSSGNSREIFTSGSAALEILQPGRDLASTQDRTTQAYEDPPTPAALLAAVGVAHGLRAPPAV